MSTGVACPRCGASTPLPADLQVPTFTCAFCHAELRTADFSGAGLRSADALVGHLKQVMEGQTPSTPAPRFEQAAGGTRPSTCRRCGAAVDVPMDLRVRTFRCPGCGGEQAVAEHLGDAERLAADMARQQAANAEYTRLRAEGVACGRCGGRNEVPDDGSVQVVCRFCEAAILVGEHVDEDAVARRRLYKGVVALKEQAVEAQRVRDRWVLVGVLGAVALVVAGVGCVGVVGWVAG